MTKTIPFLPKNPTDSQLQHAARAQGLYVAADKWSYFYLQLLERPTDGKKIRMNPDWVLAYVSRDEIVAYLRERRQTHRTLTPREVYGPIQNGDIGPSGPARRVCK